MYEYNKKNYYVNHLFWIVFIAIYPFLFRLGEEYYKLFTECVELLASEDLYENPNSLESKKHQASSQACADMVKNMSDKMRKCNDVDVMGKINEALRCMWDLMSQYRNTISFTRIRSLNLQQQKYQPLLLHSRQTDCHALLVDIAIFCKHVLCFYQQTTNISNIHKGIRLTYTTCRYLQDVLLANPCFHEMPPPPCPPKQPKEKNVRRSTRNY